MSIKDFKISAVDTKNELLLGEYFSSDVAQSKAYGTCGFDSNCSGGGGQCGFDTNCAGGGGKCGFSISCAGS